MIQLSEQEQQLVELISKGHTTPADVMAKLKDLFAGTMYALEEFKEKWEGKYPQIHRIWE